MNSYTISPTATSQAGISNAAGLGITLSDGSLAALFETTTVQTISVTSLAKTDPCEFGGYYVRAVAGGTPTLTLYDNISATGTPIVGPVNITATGPFPWMGAGTTQRRMNTVGLYAVIGGTGTCTIDLLT